MVDVFIGILRRGQAQKAILTAVEVEIGDHACVRETDGRPLFDGMNDGGATADCDSF